MVKIKVNNFEYIISGEIIGVIEETKQGYNFILKPKSRGLKNEPSYKT